MINEGDQSLNRRVGQADLGDMTVTPGEDPAYTAWKEFARNHPRIARQLMRRVYDLAHQDRTDLVSIEHTRSMINIAVATATALEQAVTNEWAQVFNDGDGEVRQLSSELGDDQPTASLSQVQPDF